MPRTVETNDPQPTLGGLTADQVRECLELGATLSEIKDLTAAGFGHEAIASMASLLVQNRSSGGDTARLLSVLEQQSATMHESVERNRPKENPHYKVDSLFLQENGEPWSKRLKCDIYLGSIHYNRSPLTKTEVDALNLLEPLARGTITKHDGGTILVTVMPKTDAVGRLSRLTIMPYVAPGQDPGSSKFEKNLNLTMPSIVAMAKELATQADVALSIPPIAGMAKELAAQASVVTA